MSRALRAALGAVAIACIGTAVGGPVRAGPVGRALVIRHRRSEMVLVPAGRFFMGFPNTRHEQADFVDACREQMGGDAVDRRCTGPNLWADALDPRSVHVSAFYIDRLEVTVAAYRACVAAGGCAMAPLVVGDTRYLQDQMPMGNVTWAEAARYCGWARKRLPTEAEWEKAARGTDGRRWPWGSHARADGANHGRREPEIVRPLGDGEVRFIHDDRDGAKYVVAPGEMKWSGGPYGAMDMAGNVSEWVADFYRESGYVGLPLIDPVVAEPPQKQLALKVYRGGSWAEPRYFGRTYFRSRALPHVRSFDRGFRCARDAR